MVEQYNIHRVQHTGLMKETISHKLVKRGMDLWNFRLLRADNITVITCFFESPETLDDEDDQLAFDSVKDWAKAGLKLEGPLPEGLSPFKPPLRRRQACPKLSSLENYNTVFCANSKDKYRHNHHSMIWDYEQTVWTGVYPRDLPRVKTCSCSKVKKGMKEVKARAKHSGEHQPLNKIIYARSVGSKRPFEDDQKSSAVKKLKLDTSGNRRDSVQAVTSPDVSFGEDAAQGGTSSPVANLIPTPPITPCSAGADCVYSSEQDGDKHSVNSSSENLQSQSKTNLENIEVLTPPRRRKTPRRSPRIQAAAFTIPKSRRSCTIR
ncbi:hypothetical protein HOLleu_09856 [Holothuria leucospilota]|uniref:Uncharacterized protein n=1 Tax=Holothuria leucospilota TaxID=206669 RepID=A0A9Q1HFA6_HOLLE|nr:hypothetical protein HOLleu_09856 [Holothuria leucospilota]